VAPVRPFLHSVVLKIARQHFPSFCFTTNSQLADSGTALAQYLSMSENLSRTESESVPMRYFSPHTPHPPRHLRKGGEFYDAKAFDAETQRARSWRGELFEAFVMGIKRRWGRERRRRTVGRAYDQALEIARVIPRGSEVLDVGCGSGFIAHHLSALLDTQVVGIDLGSCADAPIDYRRYDGARFPGFDNSFDAVLLCYVLHHARDVHRMLNEMRRVLRDGGLAIVYEDIPGTWWDKGVCWFHNQRWRGRTGPCTFRNEAEWRSLFESFGFEIVSERSLSRWRNLMHPVCRRFYVLGRSRFIGLARTVARPAL
jgi:ubiquinone/menaquinone biosynthesis C-methylase UbiE